MVAKGVDDVELAEGDWVVGDAESDGSPGPVTARLDGSAVEELGTDGTTTSARMKCSIAPLGVKAVTEMR